VGGVDLDELQRRGRPHTERDAAVYLCREVGEKTLKEIGAVFGIGPAAAGHAAARAKDRQRKDKKLKATLAKSREAIIGILET